MTVYYWDGSCWRQQQTWTGYVNTPGVWMVYPTATANTEIPIPLEDDPPELQGAWD